MRHCCTEVVHLETGSQRHPEVGPRAFGLAVTSDACGAPKRVRT